MKLDLFLDGLHLLRLVTVNLQYFDSNGFSGGSVEGPLDLAEAAFTNSFL